MSSPPIFFLPPPSRPRPTATRPPPTATHTPRPTVTPTARSMADATSSPPPVRTATVVPTATVAPTGTAGVPGTVQPLDQEPEGDGLADPGPVDAQGGPPASGEPGPAGPSGRDGDAPGQPGTGVEVVVGLGEPIEEQAELDGRGITTAATMSPPDSSSASALASAAPIGKPARWSPVTRDGLIHLAHSLTRNGNVRLVLMLSVISLALILVGLMRALAMALARVTQTPSVSRLEPRPA